MHSTAFYQKQGAMRGALNKFLITIQKLVFQKFQLDLQMRIQVLIGIEGTITLGDKDIISIGKLKERASRSGTSSVMQILNIKHIPFESLVIMPHSLQLPGADQIVKPLGSKSESPVQPQLVNPN